MILDLDVHQGDGTAKIFENDETVFTLSVHGAKNYPFHKQKSDLDLELQDGIEDQDYLDAIRSVIVDALDKVNPQLVLYIAGADPYRGDTLGRMSLSKAGLAERDQFVLHACQEREIPTAIVMGGGYARNLEDSVDIHLQTLRIGLSLWTSG
jgi:acetoin utilization deacetylase AcuC-like enzyme